MIGRTRVARYLASQLAGGQDRQAAVRATAAWLLSRRRVREATYVARDAAVALTDAKYFYVRVTTARPLTATGRSAVKTFLQTHTGAENIELEERVDPAVLGGVRLDLPAVRVDATARRQLNAFIEGAMR